MKLEDKTEADVLHAFDRILYLLDNPQEQSSVCRRNLEIYRAKNRLLDEGVTPMIRMARVNRSRGEQQ